MAFEVSLMPKIACSKTSLCILLLLHACKFNWYDNDIWRVTLIRCEAYRELGRNTLVITSKERSSLFISRSAMVRLTNSLAPLSSRLIKIISKHVVTRFLTRRQLSLLTVSIPYTAQTCKNCQICKGRTIYTYSCDKNLWEALPQLQWTNVLSLAALSKFWAAPLDKSFQISVRYLET